MYKIVFGLALCFEQCPHFWCKWVVSKYDEWDYAKIDTDEFFPTEPRRIINSYYSKHDDIVTDRFTIGSAVHTLKICRCWKSRQFPYCDDTHKQHNKIHKDNVGPIVIDGPTFPDHILDRYTKKTPNRSITYQTNPTLSDSAIDRNREKYRRENQYSDLSSRSIL